jgi:hypothetical protein
MNRKQLKAAMEPILRAQRLTDDEFKTLARDRRMQIKQMAANGRQWKAEHPDAKPEINFIAPGFGGKPVLMIGAIEDAVAAGYCKCNADGLEMVKALWDWNREDAPTISMVKETMEEIYAEP